MPNPAPHYANGTPAPWDSGYFGQDGKPKQITNPPEGDED